MILGNISDYISCMHPRTVHSVAKVFVMQLTRGISVFLGITQAVLLTAATNAATQKSPMFGGPTVTLDKGIFVGVNDLNTSTNKFLGIPFAKPP